MITLPKEFVDGSNGYSQSPGPLTYKQVVREGNVAIYQRFYVDGRPKDFETIIIKVHPKGKVVYQKTYEDDTEYYPSASVWGKSGWSYGNLKGAENKMLAILSGQSDEAPESAEFGGDVDGVKYFTIAQFSEHRNLSYVDGRLSLLKLVDEHKIECVGEKRLHAKGKKSKIYTEVV